MERQFAAHLVRQGYQVAFVHQDDDLAPLVQGPDGPIVAADLWAIAPSGAPMWVEIKGKTVPGYSYVRHRWECGVDAPRFVHDYSRLNARVPVYHVVREAMTLPSEGWEPPRAPRVAGKPDWSDYHAYLMPGPVWLGISHTQAARAGHYVASWCADGRPGWLWPRSAMTRLDVAPSPVP